MNLLARSDLKAAFDDMQLVTKQLTGFHPPDYDCVTDRCVEAIKKLCHVIQALDEEMEELRRMKPHGVYPDEHR